jgi:hypothetical protein
MLSGLRLERLQFHIALLFYVFLILSPYFGSNNAWTLVTLYFISVAACAWKGESVDSFLNKYWNRLGTPNKKAAAYFSAACGPILWWPLFGFQASLGTALFSLGVFTAPVCLKGMSSSAIAATTAAAALIFSSLAFTGDPRGSIRMYFLLPLMGMLLILLPYTLIFILLIRLPKWVLNRWSRKDPS